MKRVFVETTTVGDLVDRAAAESGGDAIVFPGERVTYPELAELTDRFARSLRALGIGRQDKVGILMPNQLDYAAAFVGACKLGAVPVPINGRFKAHELSHVIAHADLKVLLTAAGPDEAVDFPGLLAEVFPDAARQEPERLRLEAARELRSLVHLNGERPGFLTRAAFEAGSDGISEEELRTLQSRVAVRDVAMLMYTSGTTAKPKGCLLTHEAVVRHGINVQRTKFHMSPETSDVFWDPLPMFHIGGIVPMLGCIGNRATFVHAGHFDPLISLHQLQDERCTIAYPAFDLIWLAILDHPSYPEFDLSRLRLIQSITTPERMRDLQQRMPWAVEVTSFGCTESASNTTLGAADDPEELRLSTLGTVVPGMELKIVDHETGNELLPNEVGELCLRGYARFEGYYKDPEQTARAIDADGWFHTGDLGSLDEHGYLRYSGRLKDMLKVGGENVASIEIEDYLVRHPAVNIAQVVGAPDARYDEVPAAFVELKPGHSATADELIAFCVGKIATYKVPRYVRIVDEWPMSGTKIKKFVLREQIAMELAQLGISEAPKIDSHGRAGG
jgi:fatty-acyl-CoA synthase